MKKILLIATGGTIASRETEHGLRPALSADDLRAAMGVKDAAVETLDLLSLDSTNIAPPHWEQIARCVADYRHAPDGIIISHGTDTMAYTANLFALSLQGLAKPVILTGSQWPYDAANSDAPRNLATAVSAFSLKLKQVAIAFDGKLFPAVGSSKVSTETAAGFDNLHFGALAEWEENKGWHNIRIAPTDHSDGLKLRLPNPEAKVSVRTLIPGYAAQELSDGLPHLSTQALILQSYGHGNAPSNDAFVRAVQAFTQQDKLLLNISQVPQGCTAAVYAQGDALRQAGIINGGKCNLETATALMTLAVSHDWNADKVQQELRQLNLL